MENLAAFNAREEKKAAAEKRSIPVQNESENKRQSRPNKLSENGWKKAVYWG